MSIIRINELPEGSGSLTSDDIFVFMDDPSGSGITKKISFNQISNGLVSSNPSGINGATAITNIISIAQADYDNLANKDPNTLYLLR